MKRNHTDRVSSANHRHDGAVAQNSDGSDRACGPDRLSGDDLAMVVETTSDGFFVLDNSLVFTYVNAAFEKLLNRTREDVLGKSLTEAFPETRGSVFEREYIAALREKNTALSKPISIFLPM